MVTSEKHQKSLLGGIERLVGITHPDLLPAVPKILMTLYQIDVLDEEVVTQWGTHVSKKYVDKETSKRVRKASEPFLKVPTLSSSSQIYLTFYLSGLKKRMMTTMRMNDLFEMRVTLCLVYEFYLHRFVSTYA